MQNNNIVANLNNPAVSGIMNTIADQKMNEGFMGGLDFASMSLFHMQENGGMIVGNYDQILEQFSDVVNELLDDEKKKKEVQDKWVKYHKESDKDE